MLKTRILFFAGASALLLTVSCSKSYTCHCTSSTNGSVDHEEDIRVDEGKKKDNEAKCNSMNDTETYVINGTEYVSVTECEMYD
jgi:hypothetical protein